MKKMHFFLKKDADISPKGPKMIPKRMKSLLCAKFAQHKNYGRHRKKEEIRYKKI